MLLLHQENCSQKRRVVSSLTIDAGISTMCTDDSKDNTKPTRHKGRPSQSALDSLRDNI